MQLPIEKPMIDYTPRYNNVTSIITKTDPKGFADLIENYINIEFEYEPHNRDLWQEFEGINDWSRFKSIETTQISIEFFRKNFKLDEMFLESLIQERYYIYLNAIPFYNSAYTADFAKDFPHEILIYGYDKYNHLFFCQDFFNKMACQRKVCKADELINSINQFWQLEKGYAKYLDEIVLIKKKEIKQQEEIRLDLIYHRLKSLLINRKVGTQRPYIGYAWFELLICSILDFDSLNKWWLNRMSLTFLREHVKLMLLRMEHLGFPKVNENIYLINKTELCLRLLHKNMIRFMNGEEINNRCNDKIADALTVVQEDYYNAISAFCKFLE